MSELTKAEWVDLDQTTKSPGWSVFLRLMEEEQSALEGEWRETDPASRDAVWAAQAVAHGAYIFQKNVVSRILHEMELFRQSLTNKVVDDEQKFVESVLMPFGLESQNAGTGTDATKI